MEFDKSKVYTALNADELKVGSEVICASCLANLKEYVADYFNEGIKNTCIITSILDDTYGNRFEIGENHSPLVYLISEPEEKKLKWTDLKIGDVLRNDRFFEMVTCIDTEDVDNCHIYLSRTGWISDEELEVWEKVEK